MPIAFALLDVKYRLSNTKKQRAIAGLSIQSLECDCVELVGILPTSHRNENAAFDRS